MILGDKAIPVAAKLWLLANTLNVQPTRTGRFSVAINIDFTNPTINFAGYVADTVAHEIAHSFGILDAYNDDNQFPGTAMCQPNFPGRPAGTCLPRDIMRGGSVNDPALKFEGANPTLLKASLGLDAGAKLKGGTVSIPLKNGLRQYQQTFNLGTGGSSVGIVPDLRERAVVPFGQTGPTVATTPAITLSTDDQQFFGAADAAAVDFGAVAADGPGGAAGDVAFRVENDGSGPLRVSGVSFARGGQGFSVPEAATLRGTPLAPGEARTLTVHFDPSVAGVAHDTLIVQSDAEAMPTLTVPLTGDAFTKAPFARLDVVGNNNLGGVALDGDIGSTPEIFQITNAGQDPLQITSVVLPEGDGAFRLIGVPAELATHPLALAHGGSFTFGARFEPDHVGLARALIQVQTNDPAHPTLRLAVTGTGLDAVVKGKDGSKFNAPVVLSQLKLPGDATDVAYDPDLRLAVVAAGTGGVHVVDVSDPRAPRLVRTLDVQTAQVEVKDGLAYVGVGRHLRAYDLQQGLLLDQLYLGSDVGGLASEGAFLDVLQQDSRLTTVDVGGPFMKRRGMLDLTDGQGTYTGPLFVGGGTAYVMNTFTNVLGVAAGGFATVDVSNPDVPRRISGLDPSRTANEPEAAVAANGSGRALLVGSPLVPPGSGRRPRLDLLDTSDLRDTYRLLRTVLLPSAPFSVVTAAGEGYVADGTGGLVVVNYLPFDVDGQAPTVTATLPAFSTEFSAGSFGVALEGSVVRLNLDVRDDVQVRSVELLVNDNVSFGGSFQVVRTDVSFPFELSFQAPPVRPQDTDSVRNVHVQVRVTDTGGTSSSPRSWAWGCARTTSRSSTPAAILRTVPCAARGCRTCRCSSRSRLPAPASTTRPSRSSTRPTTWFRASR
jgi:hypothetical protein